MDQYQNFIALSKYARWVPEISRREEWPESVARYFDFFKDELVDKFTTGDLLELIDVQHAVTNLEEMPSMRSLMTAGPALAKDHVAGYNCAYLPIDHPRAFDELMYVLMCGTGVGFSVERNYVSSLPVIAESFFDTDTTIVVADSKKGWAKSFKELLSLLYQGQIPKFDTSKVREAGARLKTFGGRASGPEPLELLFNYTINLFRDAAGRKLTSFESHCLCCKIAEIVVVGGVRRSALISLSNLSDNKMAKAKHGDWGTYHPELQLSNNSWVANEMPTFEEYLSEWKALHESKSGERGIVNRAGLQKQAARNGRREITFLFGCNPCVEIILRPHQFCNLTEVVVRAGDTLEDLARKVRHCVIMGTMQATLTDFKYLRPIWKRNCEDERLLGVSMTGIQDCPVMCDRYTKAQLKAFLGSYVSGSGGVLGAYVAENDPLSDILDYLREVAIETNLEWSQKLGITPATAITCVKPSGTVSQLVNSASGIHSRYSKYYIRTVRSDPKDPLAILMQAQGVPWEPSVYPNDPVLVFSFPVKSPEKCITEADMGSMEFLELVKKYNIHWCEHKVSATVHYKDNEFLGIGQWIWDNWDEILGISLLPFDGHTYQQAPYTEITKAEYEEACKAMPVIDWSELSKYELEDMTEGAQLLACTGVSCEL